MNITRKQAMELTEAAIAYANEHRYLVSVAIVDNAGNEVLTVKMDGAKFLSPSIARAKALASAAFRASSADLEQGAASKTVFYVGVSMIRMGELAIGQGAFPVWSADSLLGAIGVSGLAPERDEEVAREALTLCGYPTALSETTSSLASGFSISKD